jgi:hypothetical protein
MAAVNYLAPVFDSIRVIFFLCKRTTMLSLVVANDAPPVVQDSDKRILLLCRMAFRLASEASAIPLPHSDLTALQTALSEKGVLLNACLDVCGHALRLVEEH